MIHFNPIEYPVLNKRNITLKKLSDKIFEVTRCDGRIFYGKRLQIFLNNTAYIGRYSYSIDNNKKTPVSLLIFDVNAPTKDGDYIIYETFDIPEDNQALTFQDIHEKFDEIKTPAIVKNIAGIDDIGSLGLVDGFQTLKIDQSLYSFKTSVNYELNNKSWTNIFEIRVEPNKLNTYQLFLYSTNIQQNNLFINIELGITGDCEKYYITNHSHFNQSKSFDYLKNRYKLNNIFPDNILLQLDAVKYESGYYVTLRLKLDNGFSNSINLEGYINCRHPHDLWGPKVGEKIIKNKYNLLLNGSEDSEDSEDYIVIDQTLLYADNNGEQRIISWGESILKEVEIEKSINIKDLNSGYYKITKEHKPIDFPDLTKFAEIKIDETTLFKSSWNIATLVILKDKKYMLYLDSGHVFIGYYNNSSNIIVWNLFSLYGHKHTVDDIKESESKKFVSQKQIDDWQATTDKLNNYSWKDYLLKSNGTEDTTEIKNSLTKQGDTAVLIDNLKNPIIYVRNNSGKNIPTSIGALKVENESVLQPETQGVLIRQSTLDRLNGLGIGYRISKDKEQYILINNETKYYSSNNNKYFDLVKRTYTVSPGNNSINIGFENDIADDNSLLIGIGLSQTINTNKLILGKWNNPVTDALIEFGIGNSNSDRKNAFWYIKNLLTVNGNFYNNNLNQRGYLLVNGQDPIENNFVTHDEFDPVRDNVDEILDNSFFVKLVPLNESNKSLIKRILNINEYSDNNLFDITFLLNDKHNFGIYNSSTELYSLNSNYEFIIIDIIEQYPDKDDTDEFEEIKLKITSDDFDEDTGALILTLPKARKLKIKNKTNNKEKEINLFEEISKQDFLSNQITINITGI